MNQSLLAPGLVLMAAAALVVVVLPAGLLWLALTSSGVHVVAATFCAALVAVGFGRLVFVVGRVLAEESWRRGL